MSSRQKKRRGRRKKRKAVKLQRKGQRPWEPVKMKLFTLPEVFPDDLTREKRIDILQDIGRKGKEAFEKKYPSIKKWFAEYDALYILSFCAFYFLSYPEGTDPEAYEGELDFYHHYLEIMQAFALTQNRTISVKPLAEDANKLKSEMKELGDLMVRREFYMPDCATEEEIREHILVWRMRNQTTAVRNWAYPNQIFELTRGLSKNVEGEFRKVHKIDPVELVDLLVGLVGLVEDRLNSHYRRVRKFMRMRNYKRIIETYNKTYPDMKTINEKECEELYERTGRSAKNLKQLLLMHSDLRLPDIYTFNLDEIVNIFGKSEKRDDLRRIFDRWSLEFGDLKKHDIDYFILDNPVLKKPFIKIEEDTYFSAIIGILSHLTLALIEGLVDYDDSLRKRYKKEREKYLEDIVEKLLNAHFPNGKVFRGSQWKDSKTGSQFENDLTVILDSFALVVECKASTVTDPAKRGAPLRLKRTLKELIVEPAEQAQRFIRHLVKHKGKNCFSTRIRKTNRIDNSNVKYYVPLTVTLEDLGFISSNMKEAIVAGIIDGEIQSLVTSMSVGALDCVFALLEGEIEKIHYLARRREFEQHVNYLGDELDLLGFYLDNGFNIGEAEYNELIISLVGKSKELDPYFIGVAVGKKVKKPSLQMTKWWKDIISQVSRKRPDHWTEIGFMLLNSTKEDQEKFEQDVSCLKSKVKIGRVEHDYNWVALLSGPEQKRYFIVGFPYKDLVRTERNSAIQGILGSKEREGTRGVVCIGIDVKKKEYPYSVLAADVETHLLEVRDFGD